MEESTGQGLPRELIDATDVRAAAAAYLRRQYESRGERWDDEPSWVRDAQISHLEAAVQAARRGGY